MTQHTIEDDVVSLPDDISPAYSQEFIDFIDESTSVFHTSAYFVRKFSEAGYKQIRESEDWPSVLAAGGKYLVLRTPSIIAFQISDDYRAPQPFTISAAHIDALCMKVKPYSKLGDKGGWDRIGVAPYSVGGASQSWDGSFSTWWDRDLGCAGRVLIKGDNGKVVEKLVQLPGAVASIPSLAAHFGAPAKGPFNYETNMVPIVGLSSPNDASDKDSLNTVMSKQHSNRFLSAIASSLGPNVSASDILDFELELFGSQPATFLGFDSELIAAPRMDDRVCSFAAAHALINASSSSSSFGGVRMTGLFTNEEIGSGLRTGAKSNFMLSVTRRIIEAFSDDSAKTQNLIGQTMAKSFMLSSDVTHTYNPNFDDVYLEGASPLPNKGPAIYMDPNGRMTSNAWSATLLRKVSEKVGKEGGEIQLLYPRSDSRTGGTVGPMLSEALGLPAIDMGIPMLSMHSIRGMIGSKDVGFAINLWEGLYNFGPKIRQEMVGM